MSCSVTDRLDRISIVIAVTALVSACAGKSAKTAATAECAPVPAEFLTVGPVFRDCAVDRTAKEPSTVPQLRSVDLPRQSGGCLKVVIDMVVDTAGHPVARTAKVVESNDRRFEELVMSSLGSLRYTPAVKDQEKVAQLVRYSRMVQFATVVVSSNSPTLPSRPPRTMAPKC